MVSEVARNERVVGSGGESPGTTRAAYKNTIAHHDAGGVIERLLHGLRSFGGLAGQVEREEQQGEEGKE